MLNPEAIGRTFVGAELVSVRQSEIDAFAAVIGESQGLSAPPTFAIRLALAHSQIILSDPQVGIEWNRVVHGDQKFVIQRPLIAGDNLRCSSTIESHRAIAGSEIVTVRSDLHSDQELVISAWSTLVVRA